ncbi:MAG: phage head closure protein [Melioribacteraceae bacterium]
MPGPKATLELQRKTDVSDGMGGFTSVWYGKASLKGTFTSVDKWEKFIADSTKVKSTHWFHVRYQEGIVPTSKDRFRNGSEIYEIILVDNVALKNRFWEFFLAKIE